MKKLLRDGMHEFLDAVSCGLLIFELNGRYRWAFIREGRAGIHRLLAEEEQYEVKRRFHQAKRRGLVKESRIGKRLLLSLTNAGVESLDRKAMSAAGPRDDGREVRVLYDIPEQFRSSRDRLRRVLKRAGFTLFQRSVWRTERDVSLILKAWVKRHKLEKWVDISLSRTDANPHEREETRL
jgi:DNA-binding transcriptional regulator PaaX